MTGQPITSPDKLRFNYLTMRRDAESFDDRFLSLPVTLTRCVIRWWSQTGKEERLSVENNDPVTGILFPQFIPEQVHKEERGKRIILEQAYKEENSKHIGTLQTLGSKLPLKLPLERSYYVYSIDIGEIESVSASLFVTPEHPTGDDKDLPPGVILSSDRKPILGATLSEDPAPSKVQPDVLEHEQAKDKPLIYLFNVIVALEWQPDAEDQRQLAWAFRRASEFLYDVSDGTLAFGQVVFGTSQELRETADIVIAASNRLQGRSWVGGLHCPSKRMPIRVGRAEWRYGIAIPWEEPEGYRVLVHEWGHYALHLSDAYLHRMNVCEEKKRVGTEGKPVDLDLLRINLNDNNQRYLMAPNPFLYGLTVMETMNGSSELSVQKRPYKRDGVDISEYELVSTLYPSSRNRGRVNIPLGGPIRMEMRIPYIIFEDPDRSSPSFLLYAAQYFGELRIRKPLELRYPYNDPILTSCWLYVLSPRTTALSDRKLVAQGTLEMRSAVQPFKVIDAAPGDLLVAVIDETEDAPRVYQATIPSSSAESDRLIWGQVSSADISKEMPRVVVIPKVLPEEQPGNKDLNTTQMPQDEKTGNKDLDSPPKIVVSVHLVGGSDDYRPTEIWLCPLLEEVKVVQDKDEVQINGLDGHIVLWFGDKPFISCFSHGGNPPNHITGKQQLSSGDLLRSTARGDQETKDSNGSMPPYVVGDQPDFQSQGIARDGNDLQNMSHLSITAGSSDGYIRIYFDNADDKNKPDDHTHLRFVTTVQNDFNRYDPPNGATIALSYPFSIACSSIDLPEYLHMTLEVRYNNPARFDMVDGYAVICVLKGKDWLPLPTCQFMPLGSAAVATEMSKVTTPARAFFNPAAEQFEQYQLWWFPHELPDSAQIAS